MAIAFDTSAGSSGWGAGSTSDVLYTCTGTNRVLFVGVATYNAALITVSSITYGGVALTKIVSLTDTLSGATQDGELWYLDNPASGSNHLVVTLSGSASFFIYEAASYTGKTTTGIDASATAQNNSTSTTSPACNVSVVHSDCWQVAFAYSRAASAPTAGTGTTVRTSDSVGHALGDSNGIVGTGSQTLNFTVGTASTWPAVLSASFSAANASSGNVGSAVGDSVVTGVAGFIGQAAGTSVDKAIQGYIAKAVGASNASGVQGYLGKATGTAGASAIQGYIGKATGASVVSGVSLSNVNEGVGSAVSASTASALSGSVGSSSSLSVVNGVAQSSGAADYGRTRKKKRRILIGGRRYDVRDDAELQYLLHTLLDKEPDEVERTEKELRKVAREPVERVVVPAGHIPSPAPVHAAETYARLVQQAGADLELQNALRRVWIARMEAQRLWEWEDEREVEMLVAAILH